MRACLSAALSMVLAGGLSAEAVDHGPFAGTADRRANHRVKIDRSRMLTLVDKGKANVEIVAHQGQSHCIVSDDAPVAEILASAEAEGTVTRFAFEPPHLTDLFRQAVKP